ncbi:MAG: hypothetical protein RL689_610 [Planctomycetota bacterium]|jgi:hypothetical protein
MSGVERYGTIKRLQTELPRGAPFDLNALKRIGVTPQLAAHYAEHGWLTRLGQGAYAFPGDSVSRDGCIVLLQRRVEGLHLGGKSALAMQGVRHVVAPRETVTLWGNRRFVPPAWFTERFPARYVSARLLEWPDERLDSSTIWTPPGAMPGLRVSVAERATLELLYDVGTHQGLEEARQLFESLRNFRAEVMGRLLAACTSVKAVRLFLTWCRQTRLLDVDALRASHAIRAGSPARWMTRLKDGTLLTLKQHG